ATAGLIVILPYRFDHLLYREVVVSEFVRVESYLILFLKATEGCYFTNPFNILKCELYIPILKRALFTEVQVRCVQRVPQNVANSSTVWPQRWGNSLREQSGGVVQSLQHSLPRPIDVCVIVEYHVDKAHSEHG